MNNIVKYGLEETAHKLKKEGLSDQKIADHLSDQNDHKISRGSVIRYFETHTEIEKQVTEKSQILAIKTINKKLDAAQVLLENVEKLDAALISAIADHSWNAVAKLMAERRLNAEAAARITGEIPPDRKTSLNILNIQNNYDLGEKMTDDELLQVLRIAESEAESITA